MNHELTEKLFKKYPKIFIQKDLPSTKTSLCWGLECDDGWYMLIDKLCECLQFNTDKNEYPQVEAIQVKEKFGGLRFYVNASDDYQRGQIDFAESMSMNICEVCGSTKDVGQTVGWVKTICTKCAGRKDHDD
jgi:hypothetical protein